MQDRICPIDSKLLQRTAGPYIRVNRLCQTLLVYPQTANVPLVASTEAMGH